MKTIAIMQPYFFPYLGYFSLIKHTDFWIVFDPTQYTRKSWMNRNRILKPAPATGDQYFSVPVIKAPRETLIYDIKVNNKTDWDNQIFRQLEHYKKAAPYYNEVMNFLHNCFQNKPDSLTHLNAEYLKKTCNYLNISFNYEIFSEMELQIETPTHAGEWALNICKAMGDIDTYINPPSGREIFIPEQWQEAGIELRFLISHLKQYDQKRESFEPGLSIIDVMMFNSPDEIRKMLDDINIIP